MGHDATSGQSMNHIISMLGWGMRDMRDMIMRVNMISGECMNTVGLAGIGFGATPRATRLVSGKNWPQAETLFHSAQWILRYDWHFGIRMILSPESTLDGAYNACNCNVDVQRCKVLLCSSFNGNEVFRGFTARDVKENTFELHCTWCVRLHCTCVRTWIFFCKNLNIFLQDFWFQTFVW